MDRNLGARGTDWQNDWDQTLGLYYPFGRKDPFIYPIRIYSISGSSLSSSLFSYSTNSNFSNHTMSYATSIPTKYLWGPNDHGGDWLNREGRDYGSWNNPKWNITENRKSLFDPCPPGWEVPTAYGVWDKLFVSGNKASSWSNGYEFYLNGAFSGESTFYPANSIYYYANGVYKFKSDSQTYCANGNFAGFNSSRFGENVGNGSKTYGMNIRCIQQ